MSRGEALEACRRIAPDFKLEIGRGPKNERLVMATCTYDGKLLELTMTGGYVGGKPLDLLVLETALADLRARETGARA